MASSSPGSSDWFARLPKAGVKRRHWVVTAYLWLAIIALTAVTVWDIRLLVLLFQLAEDLGASLAGWQTAMVVALVIAYAIDLVPFIALLKWRRWGFTMHAVLVGVVFVINVIEANGLGAVLNVVGLGVLYGVLQIGGQYRAWAQLE